MTSADHAIGSAALHFQHFLHLSLARHQHALALSLFMIFNSSQMFALMHQIVPVSFC